jgi:hypothetical protein
LPLWQNWKFEGWGERIYFCPSSIKEGAEQVYVCKIEKAANGCPCLVVDGIYLPNSYIDFMFLHLYLFNESDSKVISAKIPPQDNPFSGIIHSTTL